MFSTKDWMTEYGEYEFFALVLSNFDPYRADLILHNCDYVDIAKAVVAKRLYEKVD